MSGRRIWALVAFVMGLAAAMFYYVRSLPAVTEDELREVLAEVEHIPASLDDIACQRPALLGASTQDALSLEDLLTTDGPFAECWAAGGECHASRTSPLCPDGQRCDLFDTIVDWGSV